MRSYDRVVSRSPHAPAWYRETLERIEARGGRFGLVREYLAGRFPDGALLRHDIDTPGCIERLGVLTDVETERGIASTIYVLTDSGFYPAAAPSGQLRPLTERGFEVGLHTRAHVHPEPREQLAREIEAFERAYGRRPDTATMHGEYPRPPRYEERKRAFRDQLERFEAEFGVVFQDRRKPVTLADAVFDGPDIATRRSLLRASFVDPLRYLYRDPTGAVPVFQLNTHPVYWGW